MVRGSNRTLLREEDFEIGTFWLQPFGPAGAEDYIFVWRADLGFDVCRFYMGQSSKGLTSRGYDFVINAEGDTLDCSYDSNRGIYGKISAFPKAFEYIGRTVPYAHSNGCLHIDTQCPDFDWGHFVKLIIESENLLDKPFSKGNNTSVQNEKSHSNIKGEQDNMTTSAKAKNVVTAAKNATVTVAQIKAGEALNKGLMKIIKPQLPMMVRGYADHPLAPVLVSLGLTAVAEYLPEGDNKTRVGKAANLMLTAAIADGADQYLDVNAIIEKLFEGMPKHVNEALMVGEND